MKLETDTHEVILSNVGPTGEFRIRNSAKAFKILSDGLYSNKIRAIVRELSCNAVDSHVAAGEEDFPFTIHLPTVYEPWFSVRDYGVGLSSQQVESIYTTYFESTKTDSNDFIGALGLGSKSPFSYTENFSVTATQGGRQCIFSAYINEMGVPSVVKMSDVLSDEPNGVEVKFGVEDKYDYQTFRAETAYILQWFELQPDVIGISDWTVPEISYDTKDIVPGVSTLRTSGSFARMGNIVYPLDNIPAPEKHFGNLAPLLNCRLLLDFKIGELDFAASREQLSFIPLTIASIKKKLELLNSSLGKVLAEKADVITNEWERSLFLREQVRSQLFRSVVPVYVAESGFKLYNPQDYYGSYQFALDEEDLTNKNLSISSFNVSYSGNSVISKSKKHNYVTGVITHSNLIRVEPDTIFVLNDLKIGCATRAKYHYGQLSKGTQRNKNYSVHCVSSTLLDVDARKKDYEKLIAELHTPPIVVYASELTKKDPIPRDHLTTTGILKLVMKQRKNSWRAEYDWKWEKTDETLNDTTKYYYCEMNRHVMYDRNGQVADYTSLRELMESTGLKALTNTVIYGVRKSRIKELKGRKNWIQIDSRIEEIVKAIKTTDIRDMVASTIIDESNNGTYNNKQVAMQCDADSDYKKFVNTYTGVAKASGDITSLVSLCTSYGNVIEVSNVKAQIREDILAIQRRYPLIKYFPRSNVPDTEILEYIKLIDKQEKN